MRGHYKVLLFGLALTGCFEVTPVQPTQVPPAVQEALTPSILEFIAVQPSINSGGTVELQYKVKDAEFVKVDMGDVNLLPASIALEGRLFTPPMSQNTRVTLTATNKDKVVSQSVDITVTDVAPPKHASIELFAPDPVNIDAGQTVTLTWRITDGATGAILANNVQLQAIAPEMLAQGSAMLTPAETVIYTLSVRGTDNQEVSLTRLVSVTPVGTTNLTGRQLFDRTVAPILTLACKSCHAGDGVQDGQALDGPNWMGAAASAYYGAMTGDTRILTTPENSIVLLKGAHSGPAFTPDQANKVTAWLLKEVQERMINPGMPGNPNVPRTLQEGLTRFNACMTIDDWNATVGQGNNTNYARQNTTEGPCYGCHDVGAGGFIGKSNAQDLFAAMKGPPGGPYPTAYLMKLITGTTDPISGGFTGLVESYRVRDKQLAPGHPNYQMSQDRLQAITDFVTRTMARYSNPAEACAAAPPPPP